MACPRKYSPKELILQPSDFAKSLVFKRDFNFLKIFTSVVSWPRPGTDRRTPGRLVLRPARPAGNPAVIPGQFLGVENSIEPRAYGARRLENHPACPPRSLVIMTATTKTVT
jgi:hypothetical protein